VKLESTLNRRSGFLHVTPIVDVVMLLLIFFLLGSSFTLQSGVAVEIPKSGAILRPMGRAHIITIPATDFSAPVTEEDGEGKDRMGKIILGQKIYFNDEMVTLRELQERLREHDGLVRAVMLRADRLAAHGVVIEVSNLALAEGYDVAFATAPATKP